MADASTFFRAFLKAPGSVGSVFPSSPHLARAMIGGCDIRAGQVVAELGAGTGPVTVELAKLPGVTLLAVEPDSALAEACRRAAPSVVVEEAYAQELSALLARHGHAGCDRVVSSLPFAAWSPELQESVMDGILGALSPDGRMVTFTYVHSPWLAPGRRARALLERRFRQVTTTPVVWCNVPPAFVYVCEGPRR